MLEQSHPCIPSAHVLFSFSFISSSTTFTFFLFAAGWCQWIWNLTVLMGGSWPFLPRFCVSVFCVPTIRCILFGPMTSACFSCALFSFLVFYYFLSHCRGQAPPETRDTPLSRDSSSYPPFCLCKIVLFTIPLFVKGIFLVGVEAMMPCFFFMSISFHTCA